jgi:hypothetical protein
MLITQMLSQISSAHMDEVGLEICADAEDEVDQPRWDEIDHALQNPSFSGLSTVIIRVIQCPDLYHWDADDARWIADHMPQCNARGILRIREVEWECPYFLP